MNEIVIVYEYDFNEPLFQKIDFVIDNSIGDFHKKYFHKFYHFCEYDINFTKFTSIETVNFTFSDKNMSLFELNKKLTVGIQNGFKFNQINELTIKY